MLNLFCPDLYIKNIYSLDLDILLKKNIKGLLVDLDNTLMPWNSYHVNDKLQDWVNSFLEHGISLCIISNNRYSRIKHCADKLGLPAVTKAMKPRKRAFMKGLEILGTDPTQTAIIGDQIFTDIFGANRMGLFTILVEPISENEFVGTKILRFIEQILLKKMKEKNLLLSQQKDKIFKEPWRNKIGNINNKKKSHTTSKL